MMSSFVYFVGFDITESNNNCTDCSPISFMNYLGNDKCRKFEKQLQALEQFFAH